MFQLLHLFSLASKKQTWMWEKQNEMVSQHHLEPAARTSQLGGRPGAGAGAGSASSCLPLLTASPKPLLRCTRQKAVTVFPPSCWARVPPPHVPGNDQNVQGAGGQGRLASAPAPRCWSLQQCRVPPRGICPLGVSINAKIMPESLFKGKSPKAVRKALKESCYKPRGASKELWLNH